MAGTGDVREARVAEAQRLNDNVIDRALIRRWLAWGFFWLLFFPTLGVVLSTKFTYPEFLGDQARRKAHEQDQQRGDDVGRLLVDPQQLAASRHINRIGIRQAKSPFGDYRLMVVIGPQIRLEIRAAAIQPDGKIIIAGSFDLVNGVKQARIARLNSDGTRDDAFHPGNFT